MKDKINEYDIQKIIQNRKPVLFLDYDATLAPIVKRPKILSEGS